MAALCCFALVSLVAGCAPLKQYRTAHSACAVTDPSVTEGPCSANIWEEGTNYLLGFIEFDDHGWLWEPKQMWTVLDRLYEEDHARGILLVTFAHGWKHNASFGDGNVVGFRQILSELQDTENQTSAKLGRGPPRKVIGIYFGWRGLSYQLPLVKEFSFWERKRTAHMVGQGAVSEVLIHLEEFRKASRVQHTNEIASHARQPTMLIIVGHSFGGAVVYSALAPLLEEHLIDTLDSSGNARPPRGFGDLVILINPAYEAARFEVLRRTAAERSYFTNQPATLAIFTSKADDATRLAFPAGRIVSTIFERYRHDTNQYSANITAIGHFEPYRTHNLTLAKPPAAGKKSPRMRSRRYQGAQTTEDSARTVQALKKQLYANAVKPRSTLNTNDMTFQFSQTRLTPTKHHVPFNPVYVVSVDRKIIPDHTHIDTEAFITFLREFILTCAGDAQTRDDKSP